MECNNCGEIISETVSIPFNGQSTCPFCGKRTFQVELKAEAKGIPAIYKLANWFRGGSSRSKARFHRREGDSYTETTGKWNYLIRIIDRVHDWYFELVIDPKTGQELHRREHPLNVHQGYGSAKKTQKPSNVRYVNERSGVHSRQDSEKLETGWESV